MVANPVFGGFRRQLAAELEACVGYFLLLLVS
jgi:hypothetical protein